ncbi:MAG: ATP-binding SpoIIE family protein phosphatase [Chloroflexota bacterium]
MAITMDYIWRLLGRRSREGSSGTPSPEAPAAARTLTRVQVAPDDPLMTMVTQGALIVEVDRVKGDSPALRLLREAGIKLVVPLISSGELIGLLNVGPRLSDQEYSPDDHLLLRSLGTQAAPALRVAQLVAEQREEAAERERIKHELGVARLIQQTLLPKELPSPWGWHVATHYEPAREVGGDFYDFIPFPDGRLGIVIGDVTDKGVPAALMMASTRATLRAAAERWVAPSRVLQEVNETLVPDMPAKMFVTCLYAVLEPASGRLLFANAGHDLPFKRHGDEVQELRATGTPLGWFAGVEYEEHETSLAPGDSLLLYSDGLVEAHNPRREMFGFARVGQLVGEHPGGAAMIDTLLAAMAEFTGEGWEQEDDVTMVTLQRCPSKGEENWRQLAAFSVASAPGNEQEAIAQVAAAATTLGLPRRQLERLQTAVGEATMNAMEHGNRYRDDLPVEVEVSCSPNVLAVRISDQGGQPPQPPPPAPDLEAKLAGLQSPRGWGLFLIRSMVDDVHVTTEGSRHTVELIMQLEGEQRGG